MGSPVNLPYQNIITIEADSNTAVYLQIAHHLINAIQRGYLAEGTQLPGTRILSRQLNVHRKTVVAAYEELDAQGWVHIRPNKGCFIKPGAATTKKKKLDIRLLSHYPAKAGFYFAKSTLLDQPDDTSILPYSFTDGQPDFRLAPAELLGRYYTAALRRKINRKHLGYRPETGLFLKTQLANYLNSTRGLHIAPKNILITRGSEMGMFVAANTLLSNNNLVLIGAPGYYKSNMIFQQAGAQVKTIPVDEAGVVVDAVEKICKKQAVRMLYIAPHHHYPTTVTLSAERRTALLRLANHYGFMILEDDYEYDFYYQTSPILPLSSADTRGMVIYLGAFGKTLAPGFRTGFVVAPENVITEMQKLHAIIDQQGDSIMEQVLGEMIKEGEIHRHLKKMQKIYHQRRDHFCETLGNELGHLVFFKKPPGGLAVWAEWQQQISLLKLSRLGLQEGVLLPRSILYQNNQVTAMRMGFGNFTEEEAQKAIALLRHTAQNL